MQQKQLGARALSIQGIKATLWDSHGMEIPFLENGYIGNGQALVNGDSTSFFVRLTADLGMCFIGIAIDDTTQKVRELTVDPDQFEQGITQYTRNIKICRDRQGVLFPDKQSNIIRLIGVSPAAGCIMWNIALVSQGGKFFLAYQQMFLEQAYRNGIEISVPALAKVKKWRNIGAFIGGKLAEVNGITIPDISECKPVDSRQPAEGEVLWYSLHQQMGAIQTRHGAARVHWSSIQLPRSDGLRYLLPGEKVEYDVSAPDHRAKRSTKFDYEAKNVTVKDV